MARSVLVDEDDVAAAMPLLEMWIKQNRDETTADLRCADVEVFDALPIDFRRVLCDSPIEVTAASVRTCIDRCGEAAAYTALNRQLAEWEQSCPG